jgi:hypothetical protein
MTDLYQDQSGAVSERDIVGDVIAPAGYSATDSEFLYLRLRVDQDPAPGETLRPFAWGVAISLDDDPSTYELLLAVNGDTAQVEIYQNTSTTRPDDPADPADEPPVNSYPFATHGEVQRAAGSAYGGDPDFFLAFAVPWSALEARGLDPLTPGTLWAGTSRTANSLDADLACHDGAGGAPTLSGVATGETLFDPVRDTDGDGYPDQVEVEAGTDPNDAASTPPGPPPGEAGLDGADLEGGGGCSLATPTRPWLGLLLVTLFGAATRVCRRLKRPF